MEPTRCRRLLASVLQLLILMFMTDIYQLSTEM
jgi:hypothetical protein